MLHSLFYSIDFNQFYPLQQKLLEMKTNLSISKNVLLCRAELLRLKKKAMRRGIWFEILSRTERALMDLVMKVVDKVRSGLLAKLVRSIVMRLLQAMESNFKRLMNTEGVKLACQISEIGKKLGCKSAESWRSDQKFMQFLVITYMNSPNQYKISSKVDRANL